MPVYDYEHTSTPGDGCSRFMELTHSIHDRPDRCPRCGQPVRKIVSRFTHRKNILSSTNIKEKGFRRFRRRDKGVYEED
jgi:predicted nucleic acid-binding Zn ribbon protein